MNNGRYGIILAGLGLALVCYTLAWVTHDTAGFTMHAFDLAEWSSLHPAVRSSTPVMLTSLLLRLPLWVLIAALALAANGFGDLRARWIVRGAALLLALRFVPPKDFFTSTPDDENYRQMALLLGMSLAAWAAAPFTARLPRPALGILIAGVLAVGAGAGWWGLSRTGELLDNFEIAYRIGPGLLGYSLCALLVAVTALGPAWPRRAQNEKAADRMSIALSG